MNRKPFVLRIPNGENQGKYFAGFVTVGEPLKLCDEAKDAERQSVEDAASCIMAAIDMRCTAFAAESVDATPEERREFARIAAQGMFQNPSDAMIDLIERGVRLGPEQPLHECGVDIPPGKSGFMSVWEWVARTVPIGAGV